MSACIEYWEIKCRSVSSVLLSGLSDGMWQPESLVELLVLLLGVSVSRLASFSD